MGYFEMFAVMFLVSLVLNVWWFALNYFIGPGFNIDDIVKFVSAGTILSAVPFLNIVAALLAFMMLLITTVIALWEWFEDRRKGKFGNWMTKMHKYKPKKKKVDHA